MNYKELQECAPDIAHQIVTDLLSDIASGRISVGGSNNTEIRRQWINTVIVGIENYIRIESCEEVKSITDGK